MKQGNSIMNCENWSKKVYLCGNSRMTFLFLFLFFNTLLCLYILRTKSPKKYETGLVWKKSRRYLFSISTSIIPMRCTA